MVFQKLSRFFIYAALFSVVLVAPATFFPFIGIKYYFFRATVGLSLMFYLLSWGFEAKHGEVEARVKKVIKQPLFIAVSLFVLSFVLASIFAHDPNAAFWSNLERGEGGFEMIHYYLFFVLLSFLMVEWKDWKFVFNLSLIAAFCMVMYGYLGYLSITSPSLFCNAPASASARASCMEFITPFQNNAPHGITFWRAIKESRFQGTLGNPAYVAPYLIFSMFYALYIWFTKYREKNGYGAWWGTLYGASIALSLATFVFSQTRGAFIGLVGAVIAFFLYLIFAKPKFRLWGGATLIVLIVVGSLAIKYRDSALIKDVPGHRLLELNLQEQTIQTRLWTWGSAWAGWKERPIFGWGPENFSSVFDKHFDPRHFNPKQSSETWFDRAHSVIFDYLAETGIVGLIAYLGVFVTFYMQLFSFLKRLKKKATEEKRQLVSFPETSIFQALMFALPIGYFLQGVFLFDVLPIYLNLFLFLAFAVAQFTLSTNHERRT